ncbi:hypothetical protein Forpe1208_v007115 [Fusarium oxysporum f. sp. rapae]|uniref:Uncharacterized protein n=2 Tax=Fusarium oxysporum f. sp. rapae TaxID=485398 RepID=A0A8J5TWR8_FUSOX|nr:hypothetical protein Forpe1208_v007115 [Fusarium oxysporum f. sp. rapae]
MASHRPAAEAEYTLPYVFPVKEGQCDDLERREEQIMRVRAAFEEAKTKMSQQAIRELCKYLEKGTWIHHSERASNHPAYRRFMGKGSSYNRGVPTLYYPEFFVIQAIFPLDPSKKDIHKAVQQLYEEVSSHWGTKVTPGIPSFPRLEDSDRELRLILGNQPTQSNLVRRSMPHPFLAVSPVATQSPRPEAQSLSFQSSRDSITVTPSTPSLPSNSRAPVTNPPSGISPHLAGINMRFIEYDQRVADLERMLKEKEEEVKDKDFQMNNLGYKQRFEQAEQQLQETQQELRDTQHRYRESQMLLNKYQEKTKQLHHHLLQSQAISNRALTAASQTQGLLNLSQQQSDKALNLLGTPIEEFNAAAESSGVAVRDGQRANKRLRDN